MAKSRKDSKGRVLRKGETPKYKQWCRVHQKYIKFLLDRRKTGNRRNAADAPIPYPVDFLKNPVDSAAVSGYNDVEVIFLWGMALAFLPMIQKEDGWGYVNRH